MFGPSARAFASEWDGTGLDEALVDVALLRAEWAKPRPNVRSIRCLQQAWCAANT